MKWIVYLLATVAFVAILRHLLPSSDSTAVTVGTVSVKWWMFAAAGFLFLASRVK
jgi:hypothetical protein